MPSTDRGAVLVLRVGVAHALRWLLFASVGLIAVSAIFVASWRSNTPMANLTSSPLLGLAIAGVLFTGLLGILVFQVASLRNQRIYVDSSELTIKDIFGRPTRFPRGLVDRVEQYRQIGYVWFRYGTTILLTRIVCTDGRSSNGLRLSVRSARSVAEFLGVRFVRAPSIWKTLIDTWIRGVI